MPLEVYDNDRANVNCSLFSIKLEIPLCGYDLHRAVLNWEVEKVKAILEERLVKVVCLLNTNVHKSAWFKQRGCLFWF